MDKCLKFASFSSLLKLYGTAEGTRFKHDISTCVTTSEPLPNMPDYCVLENHLKNIC